MSEKTIKMIIAGPCSAESERLCMETAEQLVESGLINIFRAGIWKPRSLNNTYKGPQDKGLKYLIKVQKTFNIPVATEVGTAAHVKACADFGIDYVWLGARTVANPFAIEELASALENTSLKVMIKNPIVADISLWIGAIEKIISRNIPVTALIHRGFATFEQSVFRNDPLWSIFAEIKSKYPNIPLLADPSHMAGKTAYVQNLAQQALDMEADGLMIEVHSNVSAALSDAAQQISPTEFIELINNLKHRSENCLNGISIHELRKELDETDERLIKILAQRIDIIKRMGHFKKENNISVLQFERWREVLQKRLSLGKKHQIDNRFLKKLLKNIHDESLRIQLSIMNSSKNNGNDS